MISPDVRAEVTARLREHQAAQMPDGLDAPGKLNGTMDAVSIGLINHLSGIPVPLAPARGGVDISLETNSATVYDSSK